MKLSVIIPVYNEVNTIDQIVKMVKDQEVKNLQIIIVDDCSTDGTKKILKKKLYKSVNKIIYHKKNIGKGGAIRSAQRMIKGDIVIIQDADLEYDPKDYKKLIDPINSKKSKVVYGTRVIKNRRYNSNNFTSLYRIFFNHLLTIFSNILNNQKLTDAHTCYKVFDAKLFKSLKLIENDFAFCPEVTSKVSRLNHQIIERKITYKGRTTDEGKKIQIFDGFRAIYVLLKYKFFY
jgi:glycosyltransferase involved in cell wall biosynthesis